MAKTAVGIDIGGTNLRFGLVTAKGEVLFEKKTETRSVQGADKIISRISQGIASVVKKAENAGHSVAGIGAGVPGIISPAEGIVRFSPNLPGWVEVPLKARLMEGLGIPVYVENDANAYALGESWQGAGKGAGSLVCITLGTGVGGGIILGGALWRGADGMAGEIGHVTVNPKGPVCGCGNRGCLERYASATAVVERVLEALYDGRKSALAGYKNDPGSLTAHIVKDAADSGDKLAKKIYGEAGSYLGVAIADLINLLNIECVVIGGGMSGAWDSLIGPLREEVSKRAFKIPAGRCNIVQGMLGDYAGIIGAAGLVFNKMEGK